MGTPPKIKQYGLEPTRVRPMVYSKDQIRPANSGEQIDPCFLAPPTITWNPINNCSGILSVNGASVVLDFCSPAPPPNPENCDILASCSGVQFGFLAKTSFSGANLLSHCNGSIVGYISSAAFSGADEVRACNGTLIGYINPENCNYVPSQPNDCDTLAFCSGSSIGYVSLTSFSGANLLSHCNGSNIGYISSAPFAGADELRTCSGTLIGYINSANCSYSPSAPSEFDNVRTCDGAFLTNLYPTGIDAVRDCSGTLLGYTDANDIWISGCASPNCQHLYVSDSPLGGNELRYCSGASLGHLSPSSGHEIRHCNGTLIGYSPV